MKEKIVGIIAVALLLLTGLAIPFPVLAAAEEGSGGGADQPLTIVAATIADGQQEVPENQEITFEFSKNVVNLTVQENNKSCFTITDQRGNPVAFTVVMADDQLEREKRNFIGVAVNDGLKAGESYTIVISQKLMAKNGQSLDRDYRYTFTVAGAAKTETVAASETASEAAPTAATGMDANMVMLLAALGMLAVLAVLLIIWKKKQGSNRDRNAE